MIPIKCTAGQYALWEITDNGTIGVVPLIAQVRVSDTDYALQTDLDYMNMGDVWNHYTGCGITGAVMDTGIDTDHPEFACLTEEGEVNEVAADFNGDGRINARDARAILRHIAGLD